MVQSAYNEQILINTYSISFVSKIKIMAVLSFQTSLSLKHENVHCFLLFNKS